jgi:hypothetical protein
MASDCVKCSKRLSPSRERSYATTPSCPDQHSADDEHAPVTRPNWPRPPRDRVAAGSAWRLLREMPGSAGEVFAGCGCGRCRRMRGREMGLGCFRTAGVSRCRVPCAPGLSS